MTLEQEQACDRGDCEHFHHQLTAMAAAVRQMQGFLEKHEHKHQVATERWQMSALIRGLQERARYFDPDNQ